mmetsp:Transcript_45352/g.117399  ORF Transcript_45352/g.117399 Transcript_45352/m.117399 type:complete len:118 (-) Transcript_45352:1624-1977(-)
MEAESLEVSREVGVNVSGTTALVALVDLSSGQGSLGFKGDSQGYCVADIGGALEAQPLHLVHSMGVQEEMDRAKACGRTIGKDRESLILSATTKSGQAVRSAGGVRVGSRLKTYLPY